MSDTIRRAPDRRRYRYGVRAALPLGLADLAFGTWFGVLAHTAGMGNVAAVVMSATTFAGSAQFAAASLLGAGGSVAAAVIAAVMLNLRHDQPGGEIIGCRLTTHSSLSDVQPHRPRRLRCRPETVATRPAIILARATRRTRTPRVGRMPPVCC
jgi:AzlC protein